MTFSELNEFLETNSDYSWRVAKDKEEEFVKAAAEGRDPFDVVDVIGFRNDNLAWYKELDERATNVPVTKLREMTVEKLRFEINRGLDVDTITRITGYFAKTRGFNPGKAQELQDRVRVTI